MKVKYHNIGSQKMLKLSPNDMSIYSKYDKMI